MSIRIALYITLFLSYGSLAQPYLSTRGDFSIDQQRGCRDMLVTVTNINPGTDVILYQYEGRNSPVTANSTHNYTITGNYWLLQYIQGPTGQKVDSILVEILDPSTADFRLGSCNNNNVAVELLTNNYDIYEVDYGDGTVIQVNSGIFVPTYQYVAAGTYPITVTGLYTTSSTRCGSKTVNFTPVTEVLPATINRLETLNGNDIILDYALPGNTNSFLEVSLNNNSNFQVVKELLQGTNADTIPDLQLPSIIYCFRIASHDACSNFKAYSNELCSVNLQALAVSDAVTLNWNTLYDTNHDHIDILRDGLSIRTSTQQPMAYTDSTVNCNTNYCYQVVSINANGTRSISDSICVMAFSTSIPQPINDVSMVINDNTISWTWPSPTNETITSYDILDEQDRIISSTNQNTIDLDFDIERVSCLSWQYVNSCGNSSSQGARVCPLILSHTIGSAGAVQLSWDNYTGWTGGVSGYSLVIYDQNMVQIDSISLGMSTSYEDPLPADNVQSSAYQLYAVPIAAMNNVSISNLLLVERPPVISIPSSFTPNGDGLNDRFTVSGKFVESVEISIMNRWGTIVFETNDNAWDGTLGGKKAPLGTYVYKVTVKDFSGKEHIRTGSVLLLRD